MSHGDVMWTTVGSCYDYITLVTHADVSTQQPLQGGLGPKLGLKSSRKLLFLTPKIPDFLTPFCHTEGLASKGLGARRAPTRARFSYFLYIL